MQNETEILAGINKQQENMVNRLIKWANINSSSENFQGLARMLDVLKQDFSILNGSMEIIPLASGKAISATGELVNHANAQALRITKRRDAPLQIFLAGHMDTVYPISHPFQSVVRNADGLLHGPGVADMKGGLLIMLTALEALEKHPAAKNIGWEVLINPDEETGSLASAYLFEKAAKTNHLGLIFEPSYADGTLVSARKGSMNVTIAAKGKAAHAGRDFDKGCNAILAIAEYITQACALNDNAKGITINPGQISGGGPVNIVPDLALCRINARANDPGDFKTMQESLFDLVKTQRVNGVELLLHVDSLRGPKIFDEKSYNLFEMINQCAKDEGYSLKYRPSGGVCDGNILAEEGLPVIDTLGAIGGEIHTVNEYIQIDSLVQRSRLIALFLIKLATGSLKMRHFNE